MKTDILAIGVHPDDVELSCSATLMKMKAAGKVVGILDLTKGELGSRGTPELRTQEANNALKVMELDFRVQLDLKDGFFENNEASVKEIIKVIRHYKPEIVLCNAISDRHPDHGRSSKLENDACFYSGLSKIETMLNGSKQEAWRPKAVYNYIQDFYLEPDFVIDVSQYMDKKMEAIMAYSSQFYNPNSKEPQTPISSKEFLDSVNAKMLIWGRAIGAKYGEGFTRNRLIGVNSLFDLI